MASASITRRRTRSGPRYVVRYRLGGRSYPIRHAGSFKREREAKDRLRFVSGELAAGRNPEIALRQLGEVKPARTFDERFGAFIASRHDVSAKTRGLYRNARERLGDLASRDPSTLRPSDFETWIAANVRTDENPDGLAVASLALYFSTIRQVCDFSDLEPNPARSKKVKLPKEVKAEVEVPSNEEWAAIRDTVAKRSRRVVRFMEATATRITETLGVTYGDVDFVEGRVRISKAKTKGRTAGQRWLPVPPELLDEIAELVPLEDRSRERRVFADLTDGQVRDDIERACRDAGIAAYSPHDLRHRRCSLWIAGHGLDPVNVKRWSGHSKPSILTDVYSHVVTDPEGDEWRDFWLDAYDQQTRPKAAKRRARVVPVWSDEEAAA